MAKTLHITIDDGCSFASSIGIALILLCTSDLIIAGSTCRTFDQWKFSATFVALPVGRTGSWGRRRCWLVGVDTTLGICFLVFWTAEFCACAVEIVVAACVIWCVAGDTVCTLIYSTSEAIIGNDSVVFYTLASFYGITAILCTGILIIT